jgi:hypothetical protein
VLTDAEGVRHEGVTPVRAFPSPPRRRPVADQFRRPRSGLGGPRRRPASGHPRHVEADLRSREFVPEVERIVSVSSFACPSTWQVQTNRGPAELVLKGEEDIRRLSQIRLLIADANGIQFLVRDLSTLDKQSRKLLDRFL